MLILGVLAFFWASPAKADTGEIRLCIKQSGAVFAIEIKNASNTVVHSWSGHAKNPVPKVWNGTDTGSAQVPEGTYTVYVTATDDAGNSATDSSHTIVVDNTKPVITLIGTDESPEYGDTYNDAGATANDANDGDITGSIVTNNPVNTSVLGDYSVSYDVTDAAGNSADQVTRAVHVAKRVFTVTAATDSKTYDGTTDSSVAPTITSGSLASGDTGIFTQVFDSADVGTGINLKPSGTIENGSAVDVTGNYNDATGTVDDEITAVALSVSADDQTKYSGDADPTFTYATTSGSLLGSDVFSGDPSRDSGENPVDYAITQGTLTAGSNCDISFTPATLTILPAIQMATSTGTSSVSGLTGSDTVATTTSGGITTVINIPSGTEVTGDLTWDGIMNFPTRSVSYTAPSDSGFTDTVSTAIEMGSSGSTLTFNKGVRILFSGQAGKHV